MYKICTITLVCNRLMRKVNLSRGLKIHIFTDELITVYPILHKLFGNGVKYWESMIIR